MNNIIEQIEKVETSLNKLRGCKEYLWKNFEATQAEQDAVWDIISQVMNRKEEQLKDLIQKQIDNM